MCGSFSLRKRHRAATRSKAFAKSIAYKNLCVYVLGITAFCESNGISFALLLFCTLASRLCVCVQIVWCSIFREPPHTILFPTPTLEHAAKYGIICKMILAGAPAPPGPPKVGHDERQQIAYYMAQNNNKNAKENVCECLMCFLQFAIACPH